MLPVTVCGAGHLRSLFSWSSQAGIEPEFSFWHSRAVCLYPGSACRVKYKGLQLFVKRGFPSLSLLLVQIHTGRMTLSDDVNLEEFVMSKDELSGADIKAVCTEAGLLALRERRMRVRLRVHPGPLEHALKMWHGQSAK